MEVHTHHFMTAERAAHLTAERAAQTLSGAELLAEVELRKSRANELFKRDLWDPAIQVYLTAIWLLKPSARPQYPEVLSGQVPPSGSDAVQCLGGWRGGVSDEEARETELRLSLHLNVAACALKRSDYECAREACAQVLERGQNAKALYRLAQALDGQGDTRGAIKSLSALLKMDGEQHHKGARTLLAELRARTEAEKDLFKGIGGKKDGFGSSERPSTEPPPDPNKKVEDPSITKIRQMFGSGAMGPPPSSRADDSSDDETASETAAERDARLQRDFEEGEARREKFYAERSKKAREVVKDTGEAAGEVDALLGGGMPKCVRLFIGGFALLSALGAAALAMMVDEAKLKGHS